MMPPPGPLAAVDTPAPRGRAAQVRVTYYVTRFITATRAVCSVTVTRMLAAAGTHAVMTRDRGAGLWPRLQVQLEVTGKLKLSSRTHSVPVSRSDSFGLPGTVTGGTDLEATVTADHDH